MSYQLTAGVKQDDMVDRGDVFQEKVQYIANAVKVKRVIVGARCFLETHAGHRLCRLCQPPSTMMDAAAGCLGGVLRVMLGTGAHLR